MTFGINFNGVNKATTIGSTTATNSIKQPESKPIMDFGGGIKNDYCVIGRDIQGLERVVAQFAEVPRFEAPDGSQLEITGKLMGCNDEVELEC